MARSTTRSTVRTAKRLRQAMSLPEVRLWQILRTKPAGLKFRRQHPIGPFIADFYCASAKLVIEIDGITHDMGARAARDSDRDIWVEAQDMRVVRIPASDVLGSPEDVADQIIRMCQGMSD